MSNELNSVAVVFLILNTILLLLLQRNWSILPLLVGACFMTLGQGLELGGYNFTIIRMLIGIGLIRVLMSTERLSGGINSLDLMILVWGGWALISSGFHENPDRAFTNRLGLVYDVGGIYLLFRCYCRSVNDLIRTCQLVAILIVPIAISMLLEAITGLNLFGVFGGVSEFSEIREGAVRSQGPFLHSILAGTVGAVLLPIMVSLWQQHRKTSVSGLLACSVMILTSGSSGPILSALAGIGALSMWRYRSKLRLVRWLLVLGYIGLDIVMQAPAYFLIARINPIGSSTGWHRARLIESALEHFSEWWVVGTDYTRHWMPTGVIWSADHTDITNHYLKMGVLGGLPLMLLLIATFALGFQYVGRIMKNFEDHNKQITFFFWSLGSSLFVHAVSCISVSYFDQSFIFLYMTIAMISSAMSSTNFEN